MNFFNKSFRMLITQSARFWTTSQLCFWMRTAAYFTPVFRVIEQSTPHAALQSCESSRLCWEKHALHTSNSQTYRTRKKNRLTIWLWGNSCSPVAASTSWFGTSFTCPKKPILTHLQVIWSDHLTHKIRKWLSPVYKWNKFSTWKTISRIESRRAWRQNIRTRANTSAKSASSNQHSPNSTSFTKLWSLPCLPKSTATGKAVTSSQARMTAISTLTICKASAFTYSGKHKTQTYWLSVLWSMSS